MDDDRRFDWLSNLWEGFNDAIRRLGNNAETNIERYIRDELQRSIKNYYREVSQNILSKKKKRYPDLKRKRAVHKYPRQGPEYWADPLEDDETMEAAHYMMPSPEHEVELRDECEWVESKAKTPVEKGVLAGIKAGDSQREMVESLGVTRYQVQKAVKTIKKRVGAKTVKKPTKAKKMVKRCRAQRKSPVQAGDLLYTPA